jgi:hypothetical protein
MAVNTCRAYATGRAIAREKRAVDICPENFVPLATVQIQFEYHKA